MTKEQWAEFEKIGKYEKKIDFLLYKLALPGKAAPRLNDYFPQYMDAQFVPKEEQDAVLRELQGEVSARALMGDEQYFSLRSFGGKVEIYMLAWSDLCDERVESVMRAPVTWDGFRRQLAGCVAKRLRVRRAQQEEQHAKEEGSCGGGKI